MHEQLRPSSDAAGKVLEWLMNTDGKLFLRQYEKRKGELLSVIHGKVDSYQYGARRLLVQLLEVDIMTKNGTWVTQQQHALIIPETLATPKAEVPPTITYPVENISVELSMDAGPLYLPNKN